MALKQNAFREPLGEFLVSLISYSAPSSVITTASTIDYAYKRLVSFNFPSLRYYLVLFHYCTTY